MTKMATPKAQGLEKEGRRPVSQVDVAGTGLEHLVNGSQGKALSVYATNDAEKAGRLGLNRDLPEKAMQCHTFFLLLFLPVCFCSSFCEFWLPNLEALYLEFTRCNTPPTMVGF